VVQPGTQLRKQPGKLLPKIFCWLNPYSDASMVSSILLVYSTPLTYSSENLGFRLKNTHVLWSIINVFQHQSSSQAQVRSQSDQPNLIHTSTYTPCDEKNPEHSGVFWFAGWSTCICLGWPPLLYPKYLAKPTSYPTLLVKPTSRMARLHVNTSTNLLVPKVPFFCCWTLTIFAISSWFANWNIAQIPD